MATLTRRQRPLRRLKPLVWRVQDAQLRGLTVLFNRLPEQRALALGAFAGRTLAATRVHYTRRALANLRIAFPERSDAEHRRLLRASFGEIGRNVAEWARMPSLEKEELQNRVEWRGVDHALLALERGRGALFVSAHYGNWELVLVAARLRFPELEVTAVGRPLANRRAYARIAERREAGGGEVLPQNAPAILKVLRRNGAVGVLVDQILKKERGGILVPFLGTRAWTNPGPATLALRSGAAVVPIHAERTGPLTHRIEFGPEIEAVRSGDLRADIAQTTLRINRSIEALVRSRPEQWLWSHRRWRASPDVDPDLYPRRWKLW